VAEAKHKNVSRIDQAEKNHHGWYVRVSSQGRVTSKFFSDRSAGSRAKALKAAVAYRDELIAELGRPATGRMGSPKGRRNTSGIVGVARRSAKRPDGRPGASYWVATWCPKPGKIARKQFSILDLGEKGALLAACAYRRDREREIYGTELRENWAAAAKILLKL
jgi:hypothetical protein